MEEKRRSTPVLYGLLLLLTLFHLCTLRSGIDWDNDSVRYVWHAKNIAEGRPYADQYIPNPLNLQAPTNHPLGWPLILAPVIAVFGPDATAMKVLMVLLFIAALWVIALSFRDALSPPYLCTLIAAIGFFPLFWDFKHGMWSDIPFLLFIYLSLYVYVKAQEKDSTYRTLLWSLLAAACTYYAFKTRALGLIILPCFLIHDLVRFHKLSRVFLFTTAGCVLIYAAQLLVTAAWIAEAVPATHAVASTAPNQTNLYEHLFVGVISQIGSHLQYVRFWLSKYAEYAAITWHNGYSDVLRNAFFLLSAVPLSIGFYKRARHQFSLFEVFALVYLLALLPWPFGWMRYLIPIFPLYFFYLFVGVAHLQSKWGAKGRVLAGVGLLALSGTYVARYTTLDWGPIHSRFTTPAAQELYTYVQQHTNSDDVFVASWSHAFIYFMERPVSVPHQRMPEWMPDSEPGGRLVRDDEHFQYFQHIGATYALDGPPGATHIRELAQRHPEHFEQVYANPEFRLYRISLPHASSVQEVKESTTDLTSP